jgi:acetyl-CoA synthetase
MKPFFGVQPVGARPANRRGDRHLPTEGVLCIKDSWPGQMRTVWGDHERFEKTYFSDYKGYYFSGDGCRRDADGDYWITGRVDDVINVSGHRMGTAEVESALVAHAKVAEAAVVGYPHEIKGQGIYCYVTLMNGRRAHRRAAQGAAHLGPHRDRPDRLARPDPVGPRPAQDPLGQDHAPHPAQDRRERLRRARRHLDAGRSLVVDDLIENRMNRARHPGLAHGLGRRFRQARGFAERATKGPVLQRNPERHQWVRSAHGRRQTLGQNERGPGTIQGRANLVHAWRA